MNLEIFILGLIQCLPGLISSIRSALKGSTDTVHSQAIGSAVNGMAVLAGATPEQAQAASALSTAVHAQSVVLQMGLSAQSTASKS
jgi:uncharacterized membrane protein